MHEDFIMDTHLVVAFFDVVVWSWYKESVNSGKMFYAFEIVLKFKSGEEIFN